MNCKELGTITKAEIYVEDHGILTSSILIDFKGSFQSFGGLALSKEVSSDYISSVCEIFGVKSLDDLVGKQCYALRNSNSWGEMIEGLESLDGKRFTHYSWRKRLFPEHTKHPLEEKKNRIINLIGSLKRQLADAEHNLLVIEDNFIDWEK